MARYVGGRRACSEAVLPKSYEGSAGSLLAEMGREKSGRLDGRRDGGWVSAGPVRRLHDQECVLTSPLCSLAPAKLRSRASKRSLRPRPQR